MNILTFVVMVSLAIIVIACGIDSGADILAKKKAQKEADKAEHLAEVHKISRMLAVAGLHKNAAAIYHRPKGSHRLVRSS